MASVHVELEVDVEGKKTRISVGLWSQSEKNGEQLDLLLSTALLATVTHLPLGL